VDWTIAHYVNRLGAGSIDGATELVCAITFLVVLWAGVAAAIWFFDREGRKRVFASIGLAIALHFLLAEALLKHAMLVWLPGRARPWMAHAADIVPVGFRFTDSSFPSSHASSTAAILTVCAWHYPRSAPFAIGFVLLMAFARVHNGMHYPTDVLAGTVLGTVCGALAIWIVARVRARRERLAAQAQDVGQG